MSLFLLLTILCLACAESQARHRHKRQCNNGGGGYGGGGGDLGILGGILPLLMASGLFQNRFAAPQAPLAAAQQPPVIILGGAGGVGYTFRGLIVRRVKNIESC